MPISVVSKSSGFALLFLLAVAPVLASPPLVPYAQELQPGTPAETTSIIRNIGSRIVNGARMADAGQGWSYALAVNPGERCLLTLTLDDNGKGEFPTIAVTGENNMPVPSRLGRSQTGEVLIIWTAPDNWPIGSKMTVAVSAAKDLIRVTKARFNVKQPDKGGNGIPDSVEQLLLKGLPPNTKISVKHTDRPYTALQTPLVPEPALDVPTDAIFVYTTNVDAIQGWQSRGFITYTMGGSRSDKQYADKHPDELQVDQNHNPLVIGGNSYYLTPTVGRSIVEKAYYDAAIVNGSEGVCPEEPEFFVNEGYSDTFKAAWKAKYGSPWQDPVSSPENWWKSARLMASMETDHVAAVLTSADGHANVRKMVALHSPINYAQWNIVAPQYAITNLTQVSDVVGQVWTGTARSPVRYVGGRSDRTFSLAYLEYSSLYQLTRGTGKRLWFLMDPLEDDPNRAQSDYKSHYEETLIASLLFPEVDAYEAMPWPARILGHIPADYATEINSVLAALEDMHDQKLVEGNPATGANIGVFVSDSMQWQRSGPWSSDFDGVFGLMLPLLERGVPVQAVSLDRAADPSYLKQFKTLILSYDFQKPTDTRTSAALADWVRHGGSLIYAGGTDIFNSVSDAWWTKANLKSPQDDLWQKLGINVTGKENAVLPPAEDLAGFVSLAKSDGAEHNLKNRSKITVDLTKFCIDTGSVAVRFSDATPQDGWGPWLAGAELKVDGKLAASFASGSDLESRFMVYEHGSEVNGVARFADKSASWTYQFDNLPANVAVQLTVDIGNGYVISAKSVQPITDHTLVSTPAISQLGKSFAHVRVGTDYAATIYPSVSTKYDAAERIKNAKSLTPVPVYTLRSGGTAVWLCPVGDGLVINAGIAPGFFSSNARAAGLLRSLTEYALQHTGATYREPRALRLRRGKYTIIHTFKGREQVEGRTIDLLSPTLNVVEDRVIAPDSEALLYDLGDDNEPPHIGYVSGRVEALVETPLAAGFYARGPLHTTGAARLHSGGHALSGVKAMDRLGRPVDIQAIPDGDTVLLRYANDPDGVIVRVAWK